MRPPYFSRLLQFVVGLSAVALALQTASAGSVAGFGGSTEITQLLNNIELASTNVKQASAVAEHIKANITALQQYAAMVQNLKTLPDSLRGQTVGSYLQQINDLKRAYSTVTALRQAADGTRSMMTRRVGEMNSMQLDPKTYLEMESDLASKKGGIYEQQMQTDLASIDTLQQRAQQLQTLANTPVLGNLQGLELLNQQTSMLTGEMIDLRAATLQQNAIANGERRDQQREKALASDAARRNSEEEERRNARNKSFADGVEAKPSWSK